MTVRPTPRKNENIAVDPHTPHCWKSCLGKSAPLSRPSPNGRRSYRCPCLALGACLPELSTRKVNEIHKEDTIKKGKNNKMGNISIGMNLEAIRRHEKPFEWGVEKAAELGFEYDSSIFPIKHDLYGMPDGPRQMFRMKLDGNHFLYEIPASTYRLFGKNFPMAGGGYLRHCPYWYSRRVIRKLNESGHPAVVYIHPWEIDPDPPRIEGLGPLQRLRAYGSTNILMMKLSRLLRDFKFTTVSHYIKGSRQRRIGFR